MGAAIGLLVDYKTLIDGCLRKLTSSLTPLFYEIRSDPLGMVGGH